MSEDKPEYLTIPEELRQTKPSLGEMDWDNDALFFTHEWWDETSQFDKHPTVRWLGGSEIYERRYRARVPVAFEKSKELTDWFVQVMTEDYADTDGFWRD